LELADGKAVEVGITIYHGWTKTTNNTAGQALRPQTTSEEGYKPTLQFLFSFAGGSPIDVYTMYRINE
jgi:hypothetical protein